MQTKTANRLIHEKSPYLLQHAHNPVDWYPWGEEAFARAKSEDKPIFLSIGYSTCHWCHVMERESFEDRDVAELMNDVFISVKVDREERPDIDGIYMSVCQMMTGGGGWPLTVFMTGEQKPFFAGTYFPKEARFGRIGLMELIKKVQELWVSQREQIQNSAEEVTTYLRKAPQKTTGAELNSGVISEAYEQLTEGFDRQYGGFGTAPKFPTPHNLLFLLRYWQRSGEQSALAMVEQTLKAMRKGGIYDQIGFGFHRYSTDRRWFLPHFEKMLYDQAMLAMAYTEGYQASTNRMNKAFYQRTVEEIFTYAQQEMKSEEGGFYSAEDADSEGVEGKFYLWTEEEITRVLSPNEARLVGAYFNVTGNGNYQAEHGGEESGEETSSGENILYINRSLVEAAADLGLHREEAEGILAEAQRKLFTVRDKRVHPYKDDKILTDWNGLFLAALAKAAQVFPEENYRRLAQAGMDFFLERMRDDQGGLFHRYRRGEPAIPGFLDDYAFLSWALIELYEASFQTKYLKAALQLTDILLKHFWDAENGGFFMTADYAENVLVRKKEIYDGAVPSGNSVAMLNLLRLGRMTGNSLYEKRGHQIGTAFARTIMASPVSYTQTLNALSFGIGPSFEVVIVGPQGKKETQEMLDLARREFLPHRVLLFRPTDADKSAITEIADYTRGLQSVDGQPTAYVCRNFHCQLPVTEPEKMLELLREGKGK